MQKFDARATLAKRRADVATMFDGVAGRYDVMNDLMSLGQVYRWRAETVRAVDPRPGQRILDLAAGTGTSSRSFADAGALVVLLTTKSALAASDQVPGTVSLFRRKSAG